jgi:hypothetical protein
MSKHLNQITIDKLYLWLDEPKGQLESFTHWVDS